MATLQAQPARSGQPKSQIDLRVALASTLRLWLTLRDDVLWSFCSGSSTEDRLETLSLDGLQPAIDQINYVRGLCLDLAEKAALAEGRAPMAVLNETIDQLLSMESPKFLLAVQSVPGTF
jgi:hypothetical protein